MQLLHTANSPIPGIRLYYVPSLAGSLASLAGPGLQDYVCDRFISQTLDGLDYLASKVLYHGAVKPENILFKIVAGDYHFPLADFGLSQSQFQSSGREATAFTAPELVMSGYPPPFWTPKVDIWSLFVTIASVHPEVPFSPRLTDSYERDALPAIRYTAERILCKYDIMAREDPVDRASAAQCLLALYAGKGICSPGPITPVRRRAHRLALQAAARRQELGHRG